MFGTLKSLVFILGVCVSLFGVSAENTTTTTTTTTTPPPTTTKPITTTTAKPVPTPKYPNNKGTWTLENDKDVTCIILNGAMEISIQYVDTEKKNRTVNIDVPIKGVNVTGDCNEGVIDLTWITTSNHQNAIQFHFEKNETTPKELGDGSISPGKYALQDINGTLFKDPEIFFNITDPDKDYTFTLLNQAAFQTPLNHSYSCMQQEILKSEGVTLKLSDIKIEAFRETQPGHREFSAAIDCPADDASDIVPIAVGAALAGLVVIVLIAYLIGRRRSRSRGYQSV